MAPVKHPGRAPAAAASRSAAATTGNRPGWPTCATSTPNVRRVPPGHDTPVAAGAALNEPTGRRAWQTRW